VRRTTRRARSLLAIAAVALLGVILGGCVETAAEGYVAPTSTAEPVFQPVRSSTPRPTAAAELTAADIEQALEEIVCWYEDPAQARSCLPPGEEFLGALEQIALSDDQRFIAPLVDMLWLDVGWERWVREALERLSGERFASAGEWYAWMTGNPPPLPDNYVEWKGRLLAIIDPGLAEILPSEGTFDGPGPEALVWSLEGADAVPPLVDPEDVHRVEEQYLGGGDVVYGVVIDGVQRAYPERIIGWHGSVADEVNGTRILVWHCAACGGAAVFNRAASDGVEYTFSTAGFVWEGRRLFTDAETLSLWDAVSGRAVAGPLAAQGVALTVRNSVRTTWNEWQARYPNSRVLSLNTGHVRDYDEGRSLQSDSRGEHPAFPTGDLDDRLEAKTRVLGVTIGGVRKAYPLADLEARGLTFDRVGDVGVVIYSAGPGLGATVYETAGTDFQSFTGSPEDRVARDAEELTWFVDDERLLNTRNSRVRNAQVAQVAYWFAWSGAFPDTQLWEP